MDLVKINIGQTGGDKRGDTLRDAFRKVDQNMDVIEAALTGVPSAGDLADVIAQIPAISTIPATIEGQIDNEAASPAGVKAHFDSRLASQPEAIAGADNTKTMTPMRTAQAIAAYSIQTLLEATSKSIPAPLLAIQTSGYGAPGDGGGTLYKRVVSEPSHPGKFQSADGAWWEIAGPEVNVKMFGAVAGSGSYELINNAAFQRAKDYMSFFAAPPRLSFPAGRYVYSVSPNWALPNAEIIATGEVVFQYTGSNFAVLINGASGMSGFRMGRFIVESNIGASHTIYAEAMHDSVFDFNVRGAGSGMNGLQTAWCVCSTFRYRCSNNDGPWVGAQPEFGLFLSNRIGDPDFGGSTSYCTFPNPVVEGTKRGAWFGDALGNILENGTIEGCSLDGIYLSGMARNNVINHTDFEVNGHHTIAVGGSPFTWTNATGGYARVYVRGGTVSAIETIVSGVTVPAGKIAGNFTLAAGDSVVVTYSAAPSMIYSLGRDIVIIGDNNTLNDVDSDGGLLLDAGSSGNKVKGGTFEEILIGGTATGNLIEGASYNRYGGGDVADAGTRTVFRSLYNMTTQLGHDAPISREVLTPSGSPFDITNDRGSPVRASVSGGTVSQIFLIHAGVGDALQVTSGLFSLLPGDVLRVVYSAAPTIVLYRG